MDGHDPDPDADKVVALHHQSLPADAQMHELPSLTQFAGVVLFP